MSGPSPLPRLRQMGRGPGADPDRVDDLLVAGAAAKVARHRRSDHLVARIRVAFQQRRGAHQHPGRAESALESVGGAERLLQGMEGGAAGRQAFDRPHPAAVGLDRQHETRPDRLPVQQYRAGPANALVAADVGTRKAETVPDVVGQRGPRRHDGGVPHAVDRDRDLVNPAHAIARSRRLPASARASTRARLTTTGARSRR